MTRFSANLGFLWCEFSLPGAIAAAKAVGFDAVECHWPYDTPAQDTARALSDAGLRMLGITILIEPLNRHDPPGYFLQTIEQARDIIAAVGEANLRLMFGSPRTGIRRYLTATEPRLRLDKAIRPLSRPSQTRRSDAPRVFLPCRLAPPS